LPLLHNCHCEPSGAFEAWQSFKEKDRLLRSNTRNDSAFCNYARVVSIYVMKHQSIYNRLRRIEGQIRGIEEMVAKDRPDQEILIQLEAAKSSLASTISALIESLLKTDADKVTIPAAQARAILTILKK